MDLRLLGWYLSWFQLSLGHIYWLTELQHFGLLTHLCGHWQRYTLPEEKALCHSCGLNCISLKFYVDAVPPSPLCIWNKEVIKIKWKLKGGPLIWQGECHPQSMLSLSVSLCHAWTLRKLERELSPETESAGNLTLNSQPPELWEINVCCLSHPVCGILLW